MHVLYIQEASGRLPNETVKNTSYKPATAP